MLFFSFFSLSPLRKSKIAFYFEFIQLYSIEMKEKFSYNFVAYKKILMLMKKERDHFILVLLFFLKFPFSTPEFSKNYLKKFDQRKLKKKYFQKFFSFSFSKSRLFQKKFKMRNEVLINLPSTIFHIFYIYIIIL